MGCDIHAMIEYKEENRDWTTFGYNSVNLGRDYCMFTAMANVRNYSDDDLTPFEPKGLPKDASYHTISATSYYVVDEDTKNDEHVSRENAERWIKDGSSEWVDEKKWRVTDPDAHSHSYLSPEEFKLCIDTVSSLINYNIDPAYNMALAMVQKCQDLGFASRIVFWFDN